MGIVLYCCFGVALLDLKIWLVNSPYLASPYSMTTPKALTTRNGQGFFVT
jgi:hypothetical protein